ncbi:MAG TPA: tetratricopeptide repeat protein [Trichormus sp.]
MIGPVAANARARRNEDEADDGAHMLRNGLLLRIMIAATLFGGAQSSALADNPLLTQGIREYTAGDYANAAGHLGAALSTDYNNAKLHYYLASAYSHLNQRDDAVREYRIAYALQPDGEVGGYAKQALTTLGASTSEKKTDDPPSAGTASSAGGAYKNVPGQYDPYMDRAMSGLQQQADKEKSLRTDTGQTAANNAERTGKDVLQRSQNDAADAYRRFSRSGRPYPVTLPPDVSRQLDSMKHMYDSQKSGYLNSAQQEAKEIQKTSENLQSLLNDKPKAGESKLVPQGTNLFIRNYEPAKAPKSQK